MRSPSQKILISRGLYLKMFSSQGVPITRGHHHQRSTSHEFPTTRGSHHPKRSLSQIVPNTRGPIQSVYIFRNFVFIVQTYCICDRVQSTYIQVYPRPNISGLPVAFHWCSKAWILRSASASENINNTKFCCCPPRIRTFYDLRLSLIPTPPRTPPPRPKDWRAERPGNAQQNDGKKS